MPFQITLVRDGADVPPRPMIRAWPVASSARRSWGAPRSLPRSRTRSIAPCTARPVHQLVAGEAGVGKSRLVRETASLAAARGFRVLSGACADVGEGGVPYGPIVEALRTLVRGLEPTAIDSIVGAARADLARLVPALGSAPGAVDAHGVRRAAAAGRDPGRAPAARRGAARAVHRGGPPLGRCRDARGDRVPRPPARHGPRPAAHDLPRGRAPPSPPAAAVDRRAGAQRPGRAGRARAPGRGPDGRAARGDPRREAHAVARGPRPPALGRQPVLRRGAARRRREGGLGADPADAPRGPAGAHRRTARSGAAGRPRRGGRRPARRSRPARGGRRHGRDRADRGPPVGGRRARARDVSGRRGRVRGRLRVPPRAAPGGGLRRPAARRAPAAPPRVRGGARNARSGIRRTGRRPLGRARLALLGGPRRPAGVRGLGASDGCRDSRLCVRGCAAPR